MAPAHPATTNPPPLLPLNHPTTILQIIDVMTKLNSDLVSMGPLEPEVLKPYDEKAIQKLWFESKVRFLGGGSKFRFGFRAVPMDDGLHHAMPTRPQAPQPAAALTAHRQPPTATSHASSPRFASPRATQSKLTHPTNHLLLQGGRRGAGRGTAGGAASGGPGTSPQLGSVPGELPPPLPPPHRHRRLCRRHRHPYLIGLPSDTTTTITPAPHH